MYNTSVSKGLVTSLNKKLIKYTIDERGSCLIIRENGQDPLLCILFIECMYIHQSIFAIYTLAMELTTSQRTLLQPTA